LTETQIVEADVGERRESRGEIGHVAEEFERLGDRHL
jgi:hypothetical protein